MKFEIPEPKEWTDFVINGDFSKRWIKSQREDNER